MLKKRKKFRNDRSRFKCFFKPTTKLSSLRVIAFLNFIIVIHSSSSSSKSFCSNYNDKTIFLVIKIVVFWGSSQVFYAPVIASICNTYQNISAGFWFFSSSLKMFRVRIAFWLFELLQKKEVISFIKQNLNNVLFTEVSFLGNVHKWPHTFIHFLIP